MKIIATDNFNRETVSDQLVADNVPKFYAETIAEALNARYCNHNGAPTFFKIEDEDYKLYKYEP